MILFFSSSNLSARLMSRPFVIDMVAAVERSSQMEAEMRGS